VKASRIAVFSLIFLFSLSSLAVFGQVAPPSKPEPGKPAAKPAPKLGLPKEIRAIIQEGLVTRQGRRDIPFTIFKAMEFPVPGGMHTVLFFKARNSDLGYAAPLPVRQGKSATPPAAASANVLEARLVAALEFLQPDETGALKASREMGFPVTLQTDSAGYDPAKEEWYTLGVSLPFGKYTVGMFFAGVEPKTGKPDMRKVGVSYYDVNLPGPETYQNALETTPLFFARDIRQMESYEGKPVIHRNFFTYSVLQFVPNIDSVVTAEDNSQIEVFFVILGAKEAVVDSAAQPESPKYSIETSYELQKEDGTPVIKWETKKSASQYISQPLPLKQTKITTDAAGKQSTEQSAIPAGKYVLVVKVTDLLSGFSVDKKVPFELK